MSINETLEANGMPPAQQAEVTPTVPVTETGEPVKRFVPEQPKEPEVKKSDFDKENFRRLYERYPNEIREAALEFLDVPDPRVMQAQIAAMQIKEARNEVVIELGFTREQAEAIPGATAEEIRRNAEFAANLRDAAKPSTPDTGGNTAGNPAAQAPVKVYDGPAADANLTLEQMEAEYKRRMRKELGH